MNSLNGILFGPGGVPDSSDRKDTLSALEFIAKFGLDAMELEYVRGTFPSEATARSISEKAKAMKVRLTAHAPYFVNLNSAEPFKIAASRERIMTTARIGGLSGAESITFHAAFYHTDGPEEVYSRVRRELETIIQSLSLTGVHIDVRPETTGKPSQFGTPDEIVRLSRMIPGIHPCIDWSHLHARTGAMNSVAEFQSVLDLIRKTLGEDELHRMHMHISGIEYTHAGEKKHVDLRESDFRYEDLIRVLKFNGVSGIMICESPHREHDALLLKELYEKP